MYRLIYKSQSTDPIDRKTVTDILLSSLSHNEENDVTGALLATRSHYLQALEGEFFAVNETFFRIARDSRHGSFLLISFTPILRRLFADWSMKGLGLFDLNTQLDERLRAKYGTEDDGVRFPTEEWACLALMNDIKAMAPEVFEPAAHSGAE